tara:strand:+ start:964 stop:1206 length:243 start_codon:yes stop_codon:yes gene_type:complete
MKKKNDEEISSKQLEEIEQLVSQTDNFLMDLYESIPMTMVNAIMMGRLMMHSKANNQEKEFKEFLNDVISGDFEKKSTLQ